MSDAPELVGQILGEKYRIVRRIGRGGMGTVYEAEHLGLSRRVAVKVLRPELVADTNSVARFSREARATARIEHPNAVGIYDFGIDGSVAYIVMEYVDGIPLRDLTRRTGSLPLSAVIEIVRQSASALAAAHSQGVVHRDVKPENIMLRFADDGTITVKVVDFGLAKLTAVDTTQLTAPSQVMGTPRYMAPEQFTGDEADHRIDVYALAIVAYELLLGKAPFDGSFSEIVGKHLHMEPPQIADIDPSLPASLNAVFGRALSKNAADRTASADAFARELGEALGGVSGRGNQLPAAMALAAIESSPRYSDDLPTLAPPLPVAESFVTRVDQTRDADTHVRPPADLPPEARVTGRNQKLTTALAAAIATPKLSRRWVIPAVIGVAALLGLTAFLIGTYGAREPVTNVPVTTPPRPKATVAPQFPEPSTPQPPQPEQQRRRAAEPARSAKPDARPPTVVRVPVEALPKGVRKVFRDDKPDRGKKKGKKKN